MHIEVIMTAIVMYVLVGLIAPIMAAERGYRNLGYALSFLVYAPVMAIGILFVWLATCEPGYGRKRDC